MIFEGIGNVNLINMTERALCDARANGVTRLQVSTRHLLEIWAVPSKKCPMNTCNRVGVPDALTRLAALTGREACGRELRLRIKRGDTKYTMLIAVLFRLLLILYSSRLFISKFS